MSEQYVSPFDRAFDEWWGRRMSEVHPYIPEEVTQCLRRGERQANVWFSGHPGMPLIWDGAWGASGEHLRADPHWGEDRDEVGRRAARWLDPDRYASGQAAGVRVEIREFGGRVVAVHEWTVDGSHEGEPSVPWQEPR